MVHPRAGLARSRGNVLKYILLLLALGSATLSLLTLRRAPDWVIAWKLAILAGEYGHWLVLLPLGTAVAAGGSAPGACRTVTLMLCVLAGSKNTRLQMSSIVLFFGNASLRRPDPTASTRTPWRRQARTRGPP